jgi:hypothetical protein
LPQASKLLTAGIDLTSNYIAYTSSAEDHWLSASYGGLDTADFYFSYSELGIPTGSTINWVHFRVEAWDPTPLHGTYERKVRVNDSEISGANITGATDYDITGWCNWETNTVELRFRSGTSSTTYPTAPVQGTASRTNSSIIGWDNVTIVVDYTLPYSACTPPSNVTVSSNNVAPGANVNVLWSNAGAGNNNPIAGYQIYRSASPDGTYGLLGTVYTWATTGSFAVTASTNNGETYYYRVLTIASVAGFDSGLSTAYAALTCSFSAPAITSISIDSGTEVYKKAGENATLAWAAANGTNNAVTKYHVYRDGAFFTETTSASLSVPSNGTPGGSYTYTVYAIGTYVNSAVSPGRTVYTYSDPSISSVTIDGGTEVYKKAGESALLAWAAANGSFNQVNGYIVRRDGAEYAQVTGSSLSVPANNTNGGAYVYSIVAKGARSNSSSSVGRTIYTYSDPGAPATVDVSAAMANAGANVTLTVSSAANGNFNPVKRYDIYRAESATGQYTKIGEIITTATSGSIQVSAHSTMGASYFYKTITVGERSSSALSTDLAQLNTNTAPTVPAILFPGAGKTIFNTQPYIGLSISTEPNGQTQTLYYGIDNGAAQNAGTVTAGTKKLKLPVMEAGSHTLRFWLADSMGAVSAVAAVTTTIAVNTYTRAIAEGTLLWNEGAELRTSAELLELKTRVNQVRGYYGLSAISLPYEGTAGSNTIKHLHTWKGNMDALKQGLADTCAVSGAAVPNWVARERNAPSAGVVNQVRTAVGSL